VHGCLEGPEGGVYYRGKAEISDGKVSVDLPKYARKWQDFTVHVTPIYSGQHRKKPLECSEVREGRFTVWGEKGAFTWLAIATRAEIVTNPLKTDVTIQGKGPYTWYENN